MAHTHHAIDYIELSVTDLAAAKAFYDAAFGWQFNDYGPDYAGIRAPDGEGEVGGLNARPRAAAAAGRWCCSTPTTSTRRVAAVEAAGGEVVEEPYEFPGGRRFHFADPSGNELGVWAERDPQLRPAATPRASRRRPAPGARRARAERARPGAADLGGRDRAAVVGEGQLDDRLGDQGPRRPARRSGRGRPAGAGSGARRVQVSRSAASGRQRATSSAASASAASSACAAAPGRPRRRPAAGAGAAGQHAPGHDLRRPRPAPAPSPASGGHDGLAGVEGGGVEAPRGPPSPSGSPATGQRQPAAGRAGGPEPAEQPGQRLAVGGRGAGGRRRRPRRGPGR